MCDTPWFNTALEAYRYAQIIKATYNICYVLLTDTSPCRVVLIRSSLNVRFCNANYMHHLPICALESRVAGALSTRTEVVSSREGYSLPRFLLVRPPNPHWTRKRPRKTLYLNNTTIFLFADDSLDVREATVVARLEYMFWLISVAASISSMSLVVSPALQLRVFTKG